MRTVTKKDIAKRTAITVNGRVYHIEKVINATFDAMREIMKEADPEVRIEIRDFGVFAVKISKAKPNARNPKTGKVIHIPSRKKTHFKAGKLLKETLKKPLKEVMQSQ